jgi:quinol monooxygenase YgiN
LSFHFIVRFEPLPGKETEFRSELLRVNEPSLAEDGCLSIDVFESLREPSVFAIHSEWVDEAAFELHTTLPHTVRFLAAAETLLTHPVQGLRLRQIGGGSGASRVILNQVSRLHRFSPSFAALVLLYGIAARADDHLDTVGKRLASVNAFAFGGVGRAGVTSKGEIDFRVILSQASSVALAALEKLYANGNPQAKSYALVGLKKLNVKRYKELIVITATSADEVEVMRGCIITHESLSMVAKEIEGGEFRF